jgi:hypothetical protein
VTQDPLVLQEQLVTLGLQVQLENKELALKFLVLFLQLEAYQVAQVVAMLIL